MERNELDAENVVLAATLPLDDIRWVEIPPGCKSSGVTPASAISTNGKSLICNLGNRAEGAAGTLTWNDVTTALGDIAPGGTVGLTVTFETLADTTLLTAAAPCTSAGHTPNIVEIDGAMADPDGDDGDTNDDVAVVVDAGDHDCAEVQILNPTAVQLAERSTGQTPDGVMVRWSTVSESDIVGFHIWKSNGVESNQRSREMIVATNAGQPNGSSYEWLDAGAELNAGDVYILEIVKRDGPVERTVISVTRGGEIFLPIVVE